MVLINFASALHDALVQQCDAEAEAAMEEARQVLERFSMTRKVRAEQVERSGDLICERMRDIFLNGFGLKWSDDQIRVFDAFQNTCLPLIYGADWNEEKARVLRERGLDREVQYALVNMARRNGKTFSVSGAAAALALSVPNSKIAIFSTCQRTSQMMLQAVMDQFDRAFDKGTHANRQDFLMLSRNAETIIFQGPDGTKRIVGSFPGSVRVRRGARRQREGGVFLLCGVRSEYVAPGAAAPGGSGRLGAQRDCRCVQSQVREQRAVLEPLLAALSAQPTAVEAAEESSRTSHCTRGAAPSRAYERRNGGGSHVGICDDSGAAGNGAEINFCRVYFERGFVMYPIEAPWKTTLVQQCPVLDDQYIPLGYLYRMLGKDRANLERLWHGYIKYKVPGCNNMRSFINLDDLPECLSLLNIWNEEEIDAAVSQLIRGATPPRKTFAQAKRSLEEEEEEEEVIPQPTKRKHRTKDTPPAWAEAFMKDMTDLVGKQAVEVYTGTEQFVEDCAKAVQDRVKSLEKELRAKVKQQLRTELRPVVEAELKEQIKADSLARFQLPLARSVWSAPNGPTKTASDDAILAKADLFKE